MVTEILLTIGGVAIVDALSRLDDTHVKKGKRFGKRYKTVSGTCFRCDGTGKVNGHTCRKCGGWGTYSHRTWYD